MTFTHLPACQRRRGPGPAAAVHIAPCSCACSLDSARFGSVCRSRQLARIKAESSAPPSAPWHQSGLAMHKAPLQTLLMLVQQTQTVLHGHEWSVVPPTPSAASRAAACRVLLLRHSPATATPVSCYIPTVCRGCRCYQPVDLSGLIKMSLKHLSPASREHVITQTVGCDLLAFPYLFERSTNSYLQALALLTVD